MITKSPIGYLSFLLVMTFAYFAPGASADSIAEALSEAENEYRENLEKAYEDVQKALERAKETSQSRGDLEQVKRIQEELTSFERDKTLPKSISSRSYQSKIRFARVRMTNAYETAIKSYTKAGEIELATAVQEEAKRFEKQYLLRPQDAVEFGSKWFKVFNDKLTWKDAQLRCEQMGGSLAIIQSDEEANFVKALVKKSSSAVVWLGATDERNEGQWRWVDGTPVKYAKWHDRQPNNAQGVEHFLVLSADNGFWNDYPAVASDYPRLTGGIQPGFVCEWR